MQKILILLSVVIVSVGLLVGCENKEKEPQQKAQTFAYADKEGKPYPIEKQMIVAARHGDLEHLKKLHNQGASLSVEYQGDTPFKCAIENRQGLVLEYLLDNGIDPNTPWERGFSERDPLTETVVRGWFEGARQLVAKGADVNRYADDEDKYTMPLYFHALNTGHIGIAQFLVDNGSDPAYRCADGYNALFAAIDDDPPSGGSYTFDINTKENLPAVRLALENGADINASYHNVTPLIMAAVYGKKETYEYLVEQGAAPEKKDAYGNTPAEYYARAKLHPEWFRSFYKGRALPQMITRDVPLKTIQTLVDYPRAGSYHTVFSNEYTPLIIAAVYQRKDIYDFLASRDADADRVDEHGNRARDYLTGEKRHPGSLFTVYYAERDRFEDTPEKQRVSKPLDYTLVVSYSGDPIKIYINNTLAESSSGFPGSGSAFMAISCKEYIKKGVNTVRVAWGAMPGEPGWDASTARYNDPLKVSVGFKARYDKDGNDTETILGKRISLADAIILDGSRVPAYEFTFYSDLDSPLNRIVAQAVICNSSPEEADANIALMRNFAQQAHANFTAGHFDWLLEKARPAIETRAASSGRSVKDLAAEYRGVLEDIRKQGMAYTLQSNEQIVLLPTFGGRLWALGVMRTAEDGKTLMEAVKMLPETSDKTDYHLIHSKADGGLSALLPITIAKINGKFVIVR